jgi:hypothetical protein
MRMAHWFLASLVVCTTNVQAEGPILAKVNRFFGLGWGDGYHTGWNDCTGGNTSSGCGPATENLKASPTPSIPVLAPTLTGSNIPGQSSGSHRSQIVNIFPAPKQFFAAPTVPAPSPRVVRLPPVVESPHTARRLPPVTQTAPALTTVGRNKP